MEKHNRLVLDKYTQLKWETMKIDGKETVSRFS